jgi:hypothetical protein
MPFCAPPTDRTEEIAPVQNGGSARGYPANSLSLAVRVMVQCDQPDLNLYAVPPLEMNVRFCRCGRDASVQRRM